MFPEGERDCQLSIQRRERHQSNTEYGFVWTKLHQTFPVVSEIVLKRPWKDKMFQTRG
jgi:hypothetical protein